MKFHDATKTHTFVLVPIIITMIIIFEKRIRTRGRCFLHLSFPAVLSRSNDRYTLDVSAPLFYFYAVSPLSDRSHRISSPDINSRCTLFRLVRFVEASPRPGLTFRYAFIRDLANFCRKKAVALLSLRAELLSCIKGKKAFGAHQKRGVIFFFYSFFVIPRLFPHTR